MAETSGGNSNKAYFTNLDQEGDGATFYVQFNPKDYSIADKAIWKQFEE